MVARFCTSVRSKVIRCRRFYSRLTILCNPRGRLGAAGGGWGRPEAARHVQRGSVMHVGGRRLLVMPGFGSQYLEAAGGGWRRPVAACHNWRQPEAACNARKK